MRYIVVTFFKISGHPKITDLQEEKQFDSRESSEQTHHQPAIPCMLSHPHQPEYFWLPDLCAQKLSLPGTPCPRLSDYRSPGTTVALMRAQAPQDCKVDTTMETRNDNTSN